MLGFVASMIASGSLLIGFLPPKYAAILMAVGAFSTSFSERLQGGSSTVTPAEARVNVAQGTAKETP